MECPICHSTAGHHAIRNPRNLAVSLLCRMLGWWRIASWERVVSRRSPLLRWCLRFGYKFRDEVSDRPDFGKCAMCGYNLKGDVSGHCPECVWKRPKRQRTYRHMTDLDAEEEPESRRENPE